MDYEIMIHYIGIGKSGENLERYVKNSKLSQYRQVIFESMSEPNETYIEDLAIRDDRLIVLYGDLVLLHPSQPDLIRT